MTTTVTEGLLFFMLLLFNGVRKQARERKGDDCFLAVAFIDVHLFCAYVKTSNRLVLL
jgi:hypothetical protein